jgi:hypothetical protein
MRKDMAKVLVEKPRSGRSWASHKRRGTMRQKYRDEYNDVQERTQSMSVHKRQANYKYSSDNLNPLWRFLDKNVSRPWTKVYAEICEHVNRNNAVQAHVLQHLVDRVVLNPVFLDGRVHYIEDDVIGGLRELSSFQLYVDRHGILRRPKKKQR